MSAKKIIGAIVAGFVVSALGHYLIHSVWLIKDYQASSDVWRTQEAMMHRMYAFLLSTLSLVAGAVLIYIRGVEVKPWAGQGIRFGVLLALVTAVPQSLQEYAVYPIHHELALKWIAGEGLLAIVLGLVIAAICGPKPAAS
jgi:hypothetical protein